jgi:putative hydrolase of the HAD superfamily
MRPRAILFDFYGTLAERDDAFEPIGASIVAVLARFGYTAPHDLLWRYFNDGIDGIEHDEHSQSRDHYVAWQRARVAALLAECGVPDREHDSVADAFRAAGSTGRMAAFPEVVGVLDELRARGHQLVICSNWDWDLREAVEECGLLGHFDAIVSSAWVGARKPHPRIYEHSVALTGHEPHEILFVGDTWNCDVAGPAAFGMTPVYLRRGHREPDHTRPEGANGAHAIADLTGILALLRD